MKRVLLNLREEEVRQADAAARRLAVSRSEIVRRAIVQFAGGAAADSTGPEGETPEQRRRRIVRAFAALRQMGTAIRRKHPGWNPLAIIRQDREERADRLLRLVERR